jgi:hypothetical protein
MLSVLFGLGQNSGCKGTHLFHRDCISVELCGFSGRFAFGSCSLPQRGLGAAACLYGPGNSCLDNGGNFVTTTHAAFQLHAMRAGFVKPHGILHRQLRRIHAANRKVRNYKCTFHAAHNRLAMMNKVLQGHARRICAEGSFLYTYWISRTR